MKVAAFINYGNPERIAENRPRHREYLHGLKAGGRIFASGPFEDDSGALIIYDVENLAEAESLIQADPFREAGVFVSWTLKPWRQVM